MDTNLQVAKIKNKILTTYKLVPISPNFLNNTVIIANTDLCK